MEHITYIGEVVEKLADYSSFPELFIKYEEGDPIPRIRKSKCSRVSKRKVHFTKRSV